MRAVQVPAAGQPFEQLEREIPEPKPGQVRIKVEASIESEDTLRFSALTGARSMNELFPMGRAAKAYERMMSGRARFRVVLVP